MSKIDYIIREDEIPEMYAVNGDCAFLETDEILEDYPYILESMQSEKYYLENELCDVFHELLYENKVVGFAAYEMEENYSLMLTECYVLPEFRGKRIFFNELCRMIFASPKFGILQPTRDIVELLVEYSFARKVTDTLVVSGIDFYFDEFNAKSDKREEFSQEYIPLSNFYDLEIFSTVQVDGDEVIYHNLLENDLRKYGKRKILDDDYFTDIKKQLNNSEFDEMIEELKDELPEDNFGYDVVIGHGNGLSDYMQSIVNEGLLSYDNALEIKQRLIEEYESGVINDETIEDRLTVMIVTEMPEDKLFEDFSDFPESSREDEEVMRNFMKLLADNKNLQADVINAVINQNEEEFERLMFDAMNEDEEFADKFFEIMDNVPESYPEPVDEDVLEILDNLDLNFDSPYPIADMMWGVNNHKYKLDNTFYGKDYPISPEIYMYRVLDKLNMHNNLKIALATAGMDGRMMPQAVESMLFQLNFIDDGVNLDNWNEFAHDSLTVNDLKDILRKNNLKVSGKKQDLIDRIAENQIPLDSFKSEKVRVTSEGVEFLKDNIWIGFYDHFLDKFDFNDFVKFIDEKEGELIEVTLEYIKAHKKLAKKQKDSVYINDCDVAYELVFKIGESFLKNLSENL